MAVSVLVQDIVRVARAGRARATGSTDFGGIGRIRRVQPEHTGSIVDPDRHDEDHARIHVTADTCEAAFGSKLIVVSSDLLLLVTELLGDLVGCGDAGDVGVGLADHSAVLHVQAADS